MRVGEQVRAGMCPANGRTRRPVPVRSARVVQTHGHVPRPHVAPSPPHRTHRRRSGHGLCFMASADTFLTNSLRGPPAPSACCRRITAECDVGNLFSLPASTCAFVTDAGAAAPPSAASAADRKSQPSGAPATRTAAPSLGGLVGVGGGRARERERERAEKERGERRACVCDRDSLSLLSPAPRSSLPSRPRRMSSAICSGRAAGVRHTLWARGRAGPEKARAGTNKARAGARAPASPALSTSAHATAHARPAPGGMVAATYLSTALSSSCCLARTHSFFFRNGSCLQLSRQRFPEPVCLVRCGNGRTARSSSLQRP